jgi:hypothetical protein
MWIIVDISDDLLRRAKARAPSVHKSIGQVMNEGSRAYLALPDLLRKRGSLRDLTADSSPEGKERLSEEIDPTVYGS